MTAQGGPPPAASMHGAQDRGEQARKERPLGVFRSSGQLAAASPSARRAERGRSGVWVKVGGLQFFRLNSQEPWPGDC